MGDFVIISREENKTNEKTKKTEPNECVVCMT
jgi:hypothetical protein